jgi:hypothetical protein
VFPGFWRYLGVATLLFLMIWIGARLGIIQALNHG